eukprot:scaffold13.g241.t1
MQSLHAVSLRPRAAPATLAPPPRLAAPVHAARPLRSARKLAVSAQRTPSSGYTSGDDTDELAEAPFATLARATTRRLVSAFKGADADAAYSKLEDWLRSAPAQHGGEGLPAGAPHVGEQRGAESPAARLASVTAAAAEGLGGLTFSSVRTWLEDRVKGKKAPADKEHDDAQMVGVMVGRLLEAYEAAGFGKFQLSEESMDQLYRLAHSVLGSSISRRMLWALVRAYLGLAPEH